MSPTSEDDLFIREDQVSADLAIVFSSAGLQVCARRARHGARLYLRGFVPRLLLSGGGSSAKGVEEADTMLREVRTAGVPESALLFERESTSTAANALNSRDLLIEEELLDTMHTILLVSSEYHMLRVRLYMRRFFPERMHLVCRPPPDGCRRETWAESGACRWRVKQELELYESFRAAGLLPDPD